MGRVAPCSTKGRDIIAKLSESARKKSIEVMTIETNDSSLGSLAIICAAAPEIVLDHIKRHLPGEDLKSITHFLDSVKQDPDYSTLLDRMRENLSPAYIGYENYRLKQNEWFKTRLYLERSSRAAFGQLLNVLDSNIRFISRKGLDTEIDAWFNAWEGAHKIFALLGEEGDGKTWAVANWLTKKISSVCFPAVVLLASKNVNSSEPLEVLAKSISIQTGNGDPVYWTRKLANWLTRPVTSKPYFLLVLDGINERPSFPWRALLESLDDEPWRGRVAVMLTCRTMTWNKTFSNLNHFEFQTLTLQPFNNEELNEALAAYSLKMSDISENLLGLIRKPRYFDLTVRFRNEMQAGGDITIERLLYEDWRDRLKRKNALDSFSHEEFLTLIKNLAGRASSEEVTFTVREIDEALSPLVADRTAIINELITGGGVFIPDATVTGRYRIEKRRLIHGFGLLLSEQVLKVSSGAQAAIEEAIAGLLEPHADMDIKVAICGAAVFHSIIKKDFPKMGLSALFRAWLGSRNLDEDSQESVSAYFPLRPELYFELAEYFWSDKSENHMVQDQFMDSFLRWRKLSNIEAKMVPVFERWMGFVNPQGFSFMRRLGEKEDSVRKQIEERVACDLNSGPLLFEGYNLFVIENDGLLRLARVALAVISHTQRRAFIKSFVLWAISRTIMGHPNEYELVSWVLRTAPDFIWKDLAAEMNQLIVKETNVSKEAAYRLLSCEGSGEAYRLRATLPSDLIRRHPLYEIYMDEPCLQGLYLWTKDKYRECLAREDIPPGRIAISMKELALEPRLFVPENLNERLSILSTQISPRSIWTNIGTTSEDHFFDQIEASMCAFAPQALAEIIKKVIRDISNREGIPLRQLSFNLRDNALIFDADERKAISEAWTQLCSKENINQDEKLSEGNLFPYVIAGLPAVTQLELLLKRPENAADYTFYKSFFRPLMHAELELLASELSSAISTSRTQRLLWFLSAYPKVLPLSLVETVFAKMAENPNTLVRSLVYEILFGAEHLPSIQQFISGQWEWNSSNCNEENYWGSLLLCKFGKDLSYKEIRSRVHPTYLGYAVQERGLSPGEVRQYGIDINTIWDKIVGSDAPITDYLPEIDLSADRSAGVIDSDVIHLSPSSYSKSLRFVSRDAFWGGSRGFSNEDPKEALGAVSQEKLDRLRDLANKAIKEQLDAGNFWFSRRFLTYSLREVVSLCPELVNSWVRSVDKEASDAVRILFFAESFYLSLCELLFEVDPTVAVKLYKRIKAALESGRVKMRIIDSDTAIGLPEYALFSSREIYPVSEELDTCLESSVSDVALLELALLAQEMNKLEWVINKIEIGISSSRMFEQARSLVLAAFLDGQEGKDILTKYISDALNSWPKNVAEESLRWWHKNEWSKLWFVTFLENGDDALALAAFKIFCKCADRRFWLWNKRISEAVVNKNGKRDVRLTFLKLNRQSIKNNIKENEKKLKDSFLFHKILKDEAWPWMPLYD